MSGENIVTVDGSFLKETKDYRDGQAEIQPLADKLIAECEELSHLADFEIKFIFAKKPILANGREILGKASKFSDRDRLLHRWEFLVIISEIHWRNSEKIREPLLHHELMHCAVNEETGKPAIKPHDLEEFGATVRRYGAWEYGIKHFDRQLDMFEGDKREVAL